jgi:hypothetical protein
MEIMFDDLNPEAQERLLEEFGLSSPEEMDWDTSPIAIVEMKDSDDADEDEEEEYDEEEDDLEDDFDLDEDE